MATVTQQINKALANADSNLDEAMAKYKDSFENPITSGAYEAKLVEAELGINETRGIIKPKWEITDGDFEGKTVFENTLWLHTPGAQAFVLNWLSKLGVDLDEFTFKSDLQKTLKKLIKAGVGGVLKVKEVEDSPFPDVNLMKGSDEAGGSTDDDGEDAEPETSEDNAPDFDDMKRGQLEDYIDDNSLDIADAEDMSTKELRTAIKEALDGGSTDEGEPETLDLDEMSAKDLRKLVEDESLDIEDYDDMSKKELIAAIKGLDDDSDSKKEKKKEKVDPKYALNKENFAKLCKNQGMKPKDKDKKSESTMRKFVERYGFPEDECSGWDLKFLKANGFEDLIESE